MAKQKTWTDLLGPYKEGDQVSGCYIVRPTGGCNFITLYTFENKVYARQAFELWRQRY